MRKLIFLLRLAPLLVIIAILLLMMTPPGLFEGRKRNIYKNARSERAKFIQHFLPFENATCNRSRNTGKMTSI